MTTIAWDGQILATDSQTTNGDIIGGYCDKITMLKDGRWIATGGCRDLRQLVIDWLNGDGPKPELDKGDREEFGAVIIDTEGNALEVGGTQLRIHSSTLFNGKLSNGSGWILAISAMELGCDAIHAVEHACKFDVNSGGPIRYVYPLLGKSAQVFTFDATE